MSLPNTTRQEIRAFVSRRKALRNELRAATAPGKVDLPAMTRLNRELREVESDLLSRLMTLFISLELIAGRTVEF